MTAILDVAGRADLAEPATPPTPPAPSLEILLDASLDEDGPQRGANMPPNLARRYGGRLHVPLRPDRPTVIANFVSSIDGIVALGSGALSGGGLISGFHEPDKFVMALLRALADVVVIGAGTLRGSAGHGWTAQRVKPELASDFATWRDGMGLAPHPTTIIVTRGGGVPAEHPGLADPDVPVVIATTPDGAARLRRVELAAHVKVETIGDGSPLNGTDIVALVERLGGRLVLSEGGPHLLAELLADDVVDELFLTVAPQLVGRAEERIGLVEGIGLRPGDARWQDLVSVRRSTDHLFLRYRRRRGAPALEDI
jgi:riboflavin biosynthesis pyrimidine reductase